MAVKPNTSITNNFTAGLKTEFTGLNFPENAATSVDNCVFTLIGDVLRREGIDFEPGYVQTTINRAGQAISTFKWDNSGGDGSSQLVAIQVGATLYFFKSSAATVTSPLSAKKLSSTVDLNAFNISISSPDPSVSECQYATGNGYLFVFHPSLNPFFCTYEPISNTVTAAVINIFIRDFDGIQLEGNGGHNDSRPVALNGEKTYNLENQGWNTSQTTQWFSAFGEYPANSDVWWRYINSSGVFDPPGTIGSVPFRNTPAPRGHFVLEAFNQRRSAVSSGLPVQDIVTNFRPKTGTWFQGRVWYAGGDASVAAFGDAPYYTWTEKIYFSQIVESAQQFGNCYQVNDPTDKFLFDLLPSDGGVITIQGCGSIYKLFPIQNGLLVFAANGIWFITGSQGIGFSANDYTITKIDSTQSLSSTSYINVRGYPVFWNEEGIYTVSPSKQGGGLTVDNLTIGTILSFYADIPLQSKKFARGDYNHVDYEIQWCYRSTNESTLTDRYQFDKILVFNTVNKAFYVYTLPLGVPWIHDVRYVVGPGGSASPDPIFKYLTSALVSGAYKFTFSDEHDISYKDWKSFDTVGVNYVSTFTSGYRVHGNGIGQWQPVYLYMYLRNDVPNGYKIQSVWDYATSKDSGQWSSIQLINNNKPYFGMLTRRHKLRGHGLAFQLKISSVDGLPFDVMGWTAYEMVNTTP